MTGATQDPCRDSGAAQRGGARPRVADVLAVADVVPEVCGHHGEASDSDASSGEPLEEDALEEEPLEDALEDVGFAMSP